jgi:hypothetical protein
VHNATRLAILTLLLLARSAQAQTQAKPDVVDRGKKATVLVEVSTPRGDASGTGFCIDKLARQNRLPVWSSDPPRNPWVPSL